MSVKIIKLLTGEELIAEVLPSDSATCRLKNPLRIVVLPNKLDPTKPNIALAPWAEFTDEREFFIDKSHVLAIMTPIKEFINQYNSMFGGLVLPTNNLIVPGV